MAYLARSDLFLAPVTNNTNSLGVNNSNLDYYVSFTAYPTSNERALVSFYPIDSSGTITDQPTQVLCPQTQYAVRVILPSLINANQGILSSTNLQSANTQSTNTQSANVQSTNLQSANTQSIQSTNAQSIQSTNAGLVNIQNQPSENMMASIQAQSTNTNLPAANINLPANSQATINVPGNAKTNVSVPGSTQATINVPSNTQATVNTPTGNISADNISTNNGMARSNITFTPVNYSNGQTNATYNMTKGYSERMRNRRTSSKCRNRHQHYIAAQHANRPSSQFPTNTQNINQGIDQNINQGLNQNVNQGINQNVNQGINQNVNQGVNQDINQGMGLVQDMFLGVTPTNSVYKLIPITSTQDLLIFEPISSTNNGVPIGIQLDQSFPASLHKLGASPSLPDASMYTIKNSNNFQVGGYSQAFPQVISDCHKCGCSNSSICGNNGLCVSTNQSTNMTTATAGAIGGAAAGAAAGAVTGATGGTTGGTTTGTTTGGTTTGNITINKKCINCGDNNGTCTGKCPNNWQECAKKDGVYYCKTIWWKYPAAWIGFIILGLLILGLLIYLLYLAFRKPKAVEPTESEPLLMTQPVAGVQNSPGTGAAFIPVSNQTQILTPTSNQAQIPAQTAPEGANFPIENAVLLSTQPSTPINPTITPIPTAVPASTRQRPTVAIGNTVY